MFILAVGIGLIFFYVVAQKTIDSSSQERMKTNVARQSEHLRTILNIHYSYLEGIAEKIAESNELMNEENKEVLTIFQKNTSLDRLALIDPEGNAYYDNGVEKNVSHRRYFKEGISGNRTLTTKEAVRTKAEQLMAETKKLVFDEMDGKGITISVGIALAPEHGKTYMNLYRSADRALYETKRNGRNGFTICGEN